MVFKQNSNGMKNKTEINSEEKKSYKESFCISTKPLSLLICSLSLSPNLLRLMNPTIHL